ncbi:MAG: DUF3298 domain-containing protein, partial [Oscillospiraceae bacterium]|nr:DUF3298 domain-containing protein [Oscillospiraceae bacterium]
MKRKIGLLSLTLALALLLAGCGGGNADKGTPVEPTPETVDTPEPEPEPAFRPVIGLTPDADFHYDENLEAVVNRMETELAGVDELTRETYPGLADALDRLRENALSTAREAFQERESAVAEIIADGGAGYELYGEMRHLIRRADAQVVSVVNAWSEYAGGVHESYGYAVSNFDAATGAEITLESLLTAEGKLTLNSRLGEELDALYPDLAPGYMIADYLTDDYAFSVEPDGVTFWFNPYEIASFADGLLTVKLYFDRDADILNGAYKGEDEAWFVEIGNEIPYRFASSGGTPRKAEFWKIDSMDGYDWYSGFGFEFDGPEGSDRWLERPVVISDESPWTAPEGRIMALSNTGFFDANAYYAHIPEGDYMVVTLSMEDDCQGVMVYDANGSLVNGLDLTGPDGFEYPEPPENYEDVDDWSLYDSYRISPTDPYKMRLTKRLDLFGTWSADGVYSLTADGVQPV